MARDYRKLRVFALADRLVVAIYRITLRFPRDESFGLRAQIRRAYVSTALNIVEGTARPTQKDYVHFLNIALASATEGRYALDLASRLGFIAFEDVAGLIQSSDELIRSLQKLIVSLNMAEAQSPARSPKPEA